MIRFIAKRLFSVPITVLLVSLLVFFLSKAVPYDPVDSMISLEQGESAISDQISTSSGLREAMIKKLGLDLPLFYFSLAPEHLNPKNNIYVSEHLEYNYDLLIHKGYSAQDALQLASKPLNELTQLNNQFRLRLPHFYWHGHKNQFHIWFSRMLTGDFGVSFLDGRAVSQKISEALKWTMFMIIIALLIAFSVGMALGLFHAYDEHHRFIKVINLINYFIYAMPLFWLATLALIFFTTKDYGQWTNIFATPTVVIDEGQGFWYSLASYGHILILPILLLSLSSLSYISRQMYGSLVKESDKLYAATARIKGLSDLQTIKKHTLRNALFPMITLFTSALPSSIAGSVVIETIFNIPGMGRLLLNSITLADWNVVFAIVVVTAIVTALSFLLSDILYYVLNPKMRLTTA